MKLSSIINEQIATHYLKNPELTTFLNFQYPTMALQFGGFVNEFCYRLNILVSPYVNTAAFELTNHCNLQCTMCPHAKSELRKKGFMDFGMFKNILQANPYLNLVQLNGWGEPFIHPRIIEFIRYAKSKGKRVYLYSNGTMIQGELIHKVLTIGLDRVIISIDGVDKIYEKIRGYPYPRIEKQVMQLIKERNKLQSLLVIDVSMLGSKETEKSIDEFKKRWKGRADNVQVLSYFNHTIKPRYTKCRELWRGNPQILWDGSITACCVDWDGNFTFAKIGPDGYNLRRMWNSKKIMMLRYLHIKRKFHHVCHRCNEYSSDKVTNRFGR